MTTNQPDADLVSLIAAHEAFTGICACGWEAAEGTALEVWQQECAHLADVLAPYIAEREARAVQSAYALTKPKPGVGAEIEVPVVRSDRAAQHRSKP